MEKGKKVKQYLVIGCPYDLKDKLKSIKPTSTKKWWRYRNKAWDLIIQDGHITKKFEKKLKSFATLNKLDLYERNWNGSKHMDNTQPHGMPPSAIIIHPP